MKRERSLSKSSQTPKKNPLPRAPLSRNLKQNSSYTLTSFNSQSQLDRRNFTSPTHSTSNGHFKSTKSPSMIKSSITSKNRTEFQPSGLVEQQSGNKNKVFTLEDQLLKSSQSLKISDSRTDKGHQRKIRKDAEGNNIEVVTDFCVHDYKHACRTCKEMESISQTTKVLTRKYNSNNLIQSTKMQSSAT